MAHLRSDNLVEGDEDGSADSPGHWELTPTTVRPGEEGRKPELRHET